MDPCKVLLSRGRFQTLVDAQIELQDLLFVQGTSKLKQVVGGCGCILQFEKDIRHTWQTQAWNSVM